MRKVQSGMAITWWPGNGTFWREESDPEKPEKPRQSLRTLYVAERDQENMRVLCVAVTQCQLGAPGTIGWVDQASFYAASTGSMPGMRRALRVWHPANNVDLCLDIEKCIAAGGTGKEGIGQDQANGAWKALETTLGRNLAATFRGRSA